MDWVTSKSKNNLLSNPSLTGAEFQASRRGTQSSAVDNPFQLPGEFVVDPQGLLRLTYRSQYCADFAEPLVLVAAIKEARLGLKYG